MKIQANFNHVLGRNISKVQGLGSMNFFLSNTFRLWNNSKEHHIPYEQTLQLANCEEMDWYISLERCLRNSALNTGTVASVFKISSAMFWLLQSTFQSLTFSGLWFHIQHITNMKRGIAEEKWKPEGGKEGQGLNRWEETNSDWHIGGTFFSLWILNKAMLVF